MTGSDFPFDRRVLRANEVHDARDDNWAEVDRYGEFFWLMKRVYQSLSTAFNEGFASQEITLAQYLVLSTLHAEPRLSSAEVARRCFISAQAANVTIARLEAMALIRRRPSAAGGRALEATVTKRGETILVDCKKLTRGIGAHIFADIDGSDIETANAVLAGLAAELDRPAKIRPLRPWASSGDSAGTGRPRRIAGKPNAHRP